MSAHVAEIIPLVSPAELKRSLGAMAETARHLRGQLLAVERQLRFAPRVNDRYFLCAELCFAAPEIEDICETLTRVEDAL